MENCKCKELYALYNDLGIVKCQYCIKKVDDKRAREWLKYNGIEEMKEGKE